MNNRMDNLPRALLVLAVTTGTILAASYAFMAHNFLLMIGVVGVAPMIALVNNPAGWIVIIIGLSQSGLILPGLPRGLEVVHLFMAGYCGLMLGRSMVLKPHQERIPWSFIWVWALMAVLAFTISQRGFGLLASGGNTIGGTAYVKIFIACGFLLCSRYIGLTTTQWKWAITLLTLGSFLPAAAQLLFIASHGSVTVQYLFVQATQSLLPNTMDAVSRGSQVLRFETLGPVAQSLLIAVLLFNTRRHGFTLLTLGLIVVCLAMAGLTGFRTLIIELVCVIMIYRWLVAPPGQRLRLTAVYVSLLLASLAVLIAVAGYLPQSMQRALSWLPFARIDPVAMTEAHTSTLWRLELWKYCWSQVPEYLWIGRGFSMNMDDILSYSVMRDEILSFWFSHSYHNGPLSILLDTGLPGTVALLLFMIAVLREITRNMKPPENDFVYRFFNVIKAKLLFGIFSYWFIFGDARVALPNLLILLAIFYALRVTHLALQEKRTGRRFALVDPTFGTARPERPLPQS